MTKRVIVAGATGMVGGLCARMAAEDDAVDEVVAIGRRPSGVEGVRDVAHADFTDFTGVEDALSGHDAALFCIGAYSGQVPDDVFRAITVDYAVAFGEAIRAHSPEASLCLLSGQGADPSGKSRMAFARYKGEAEKALGEMGFPRLHVFRPGYIYPVTPREEPSLMYRASRALWPALRVVWPNAGIPSEDLARAMVHAALHGRGDRPSVLENRDIRALASELVQAH